MNRKNIRTTVSLTLDVVDQLIDTDNETSSSPPFKQQQQESGSIELLKKT
jgi:hypothetical protein